MKVLTPDPLVYQRAKEEWDAVAKPIDALGEFEDLVCRLASMQGTTEIDIAKRCVIVFCADNGIVSQGVSQSGQEVTAEVAAWIGKGESSVCHLARACHTDVLAVDVGIATDEMLPGVLDRKIACGTHDFLTGPAMSKEECRQAMQVGMDLVRDRKEQGYTILATGEMGIGNTTTSAAVSAALLGIVPEQITGMGAGLTSDGLARKTNVIRQALNSYAHLTDPEEILQHLGGLDLAALTGAFLGGACYGMPIVIDGFISATAALLAERIAPGAAAWMLASHRGKEPGVAHILEVLGLRPVIDARMALGEGTGAVLLFALLDPVCAFYRNGKRFRETPITPYERYTSGVECRPNRGHVPWRGADKEKSC